MPIYEFICSDCGHPFEELVFSASAIEEVTCPECNSPLVSKQISSFASQIAGGSSSFTSTASAPSCSSGSV